MTLSQWFNYLIALFAITNAFGNVGIFIGLTLDKSQHERRRIAVTAGVAVLIVLLVSCWCGDYILRAFGISLAAFQLAGGIIITLMGLSMLQAKNVMSQTTTEQVEVKNKESIAVVPLGIPIIAGPGAFATIMINAHEFPTLIDRMFSSLADITVALIIMLSLIFADPISRIVGASGIKLITRIMGMILVAMAMQMFIDGLQASFPLWGKSGANALLFD